MVRKCPGLLSERKVRASNGSRLLPGIGVNLSGRICPPASAALSLSLSLCLSLLLSLSLSFLLGVWGSGKRAPLPLSQSLVRSHTRSVCICLSLSLSLAISLSLSLALSLTCLPAFLSHGRLGTSPPSLRAALRRVSEFGVGVSLSLTLPPSLSFFLYGT